MVFFMVWEGERTDQSHAGYHEKESFHLPKITFFHGPSPFLLTFAALLVSSTEELKGNPVQTGDCSRNCKACKRISKSHCL